MSKQQVKSIAHLQIDSADFFVLYTRIGDALHAAGDMNLNDVATSLMLQAKAMNVSFDVLIDQLTICARQVYKQPDSKLISIN